MDLLRKAVAPGIRGLFLGASVLLLASANTLGQSGSIGSSWEGLRYDVGGCCYPPDPHGAPGPAGIIATVNLQISYFTKAGSTVWGPVGLQTFWSSVGNSGGNADPKVIFDQDSRRFFVIMQENDGIANFWINVAVSRGPDPRSSSTADWIFYRFNQSDNGSGGKWWGDYPGLAVDTQALYVTYDMVPFSGSGARVLFIMDKSKLISGTGTVVALQLPWQPPFVDNVQPVTPVGGSPSNLMYMVVVADDNITFTNNKALLIYAVSDPLGSRTLSSQVVSVSDRGWAPTDCAPQLGSTYGVGTLGSTTQDNASWVAGDIWVCVTRGQAAGPSVVVYHRLRLNGWPAQGSVTVVEDNTVGDTNYWNLQPAIGANAAGAVCMTWTRCSSSSYPTMMYAVRLPNESAFGPPQVVKASATDSQYANCRWGDFASVWPDPTDCSFWIVHEWITSDHSWSTWWAQIQVPPCNLLQLSGISLSNRICRLVLNGPAGADYGVQSSSNLVNWLPLLTNTIPAGGSVTIVDPSTTNQSRRFYRLLKPTPTAALVQHASNFGHGVSSVSKAFPSPNGAGNLLVVAAAGGNTMSVSDSLGNSYAAAVNNYVGGGNSGHLYIWYAKNSKAGANAVTISSSGDYDMQIYEVFGADAAAPLDKIGTSFGTGGSPSVSTPATSAANEWVFAFLFDWNHSVNLTAGGGYTLEESTHNTAGFQSSGGEDKIVASAGAQTATMSGVGSDAWMFGIVTFKAAGAGP